MFNVGRKCDISSLREREHSVFVDAPGQKEQQQSDKVYKVLEVDCRLGVEIDINYSLTSCVSTGRGFWING